MPTIKEQLKNVDLYKLGGDDMCDCFIQVVDLQMDEGVESISLKELRLLLLNYKSHAEELESETVNAIVGKTDDTVQH